MTLLLGLMQAAPGFFRPKWRKNNFSGGTPPKRLRGLHEVLANEHSH